MIDSFIIEYVTLKSVKIFIDDVVIINVFISHRDFERNLNRRIYDNTNNKKNSKMNNYKNVSNITRRH